MAGMAAVAGECDDYYEEIVIDRGEPDWSMWEHPWVGPTAPAVIAESLEHAGRYCDFVRSHWSTRIVMASGGFDPIHPGHVGYLLQAADLADTICGMLVVVVNGDGFLTRKKGRPFMPLADRCAVVAGLRGVGLVVPFEDVGQTVDRALESLRPHTFVKGGDRSDADSIPEWDTCQRLDIRIHTDIGPDKAWSSSDLIARNFSGARESQWTCPNCGSRDPRCQCEP